MPSLEGHLFRYVPSTSAQETLLSSCGWLLALIVLPVVVAFFLGGFPLGLVSLDVRVMSFQAIYTTIGLPLMFYIFDFSLPGLSNWVVLALYLTGQALIQMFFFILGSSKLGMLRVLGPVFYAALLVLVYTLREIIIFFHSIWSKRHNDSSFSEEGTELAGISLSQNLMENQAEERGVTVAEHREDEGPALQIVSSEQGRLFNLSRERATTATYPTLRKKSNTEGGNSMKAGRVKYRLGQLLLAILILGGLFAMFVGCQKFASFYLHAETTHVATKTVIFFVFAVSISLMRFFFKRLARVSDANKFDGPSLEVCVEIFSSCFYFIFYRALFAHVYGWGEFCAIKVLHVALELMVHPMRMTMTYHRFSTWLQDRTAGWTITRLLRDDCTREMYLIRLSVDFMIRRVVAQCSTVTALAMVPFVRYGWNKASYGEFTARDFSRSQYDKFIWFLVVGMVVEVLLLLCLQLWLSWSGLLNLWQPIVALLKSRPRAYVPFFVFTAAHIITDVFLATVIL